MQSFVDNGRDECPVPETNEDIDLIHVREFQIFHQFRYQGLLEVCPNHDTPRAKHRGPLSLHVEEQSCRKRERKGEYMMYMYVGVLIGNVLQIYISMTLGTSYFHEYFYKDNIYMIVLKLPMLINITLKTSCNVLIRGH